LDCKLSAIIVDSDASRRVRLKAMLSASGAFTKTQGVKTTAEALECLRKKQSTNVVLVSARFSKAQLLGFLQEARKFEQTGNPLALVLLGEANGRDRAGVASDVLAGFNEILVEPYSVNSILEVCNLAFVVRSVDAKELVGSALEELISAAVAYLDEMAQRASKEEPIGAAKAKLRDVRAALSSLSTEQYRDYIEILSARCEAATAPEISEKRIREEQKRQEEAAKKQEPQRKPEVLVIRR
jgi:CheY-like chemotaxis protein